MFEVIIYNDDLNDALTKIKRKLLGDFLGLFID